MRGTIVSADDDSELVLRVREGEVEGHQEDPDEGEEYFQLSRHLISALLWLNGQSAME